MPEFSAIRRKKTYVEVVAQLRDLIQRGELPPGQRLPPERELAQHLGISRPTLREALAALEIQGYVTIINGRGTFVAEARPASSGVSARWIPHVEDSPFHVLEVRQMLEPPAAALAALRAGEDDLVSLEALLERMAAHVAATGQLKLEDDYEFHLRIARATENPLCYRLMEAVTEHMKHPLWGRLKGRTYEKPGRGALYLEQHRRIVEALKKRNAEQARAAMAEHLRQVEADLLSEPDEDGRRSEA